MNEHGEEELNRYEASLKDAYSKEKGCDFSNDIPKKISIKEFDEVMKRTVLIDETIDLYGLESWIFEKTENSQLVGKVLKQLRFDGLGLELTPSSVVAISQCTKFLCTCMLNTIDSRRHVNINPIILDFLLVDDISDNLAKYIHAYLLADKPIILSYVESQNENYRKFQTQYYKKLLGIIREELFNIVENEFRKNNSLNLFNEQILSNKLALVNDKVSKSVLQIEEGSVKVFVIKSRYQEID